MANTLRKMVPERVKKWLRPLYAPKPYIPDAVKTDWSKPFQVLGGRWDVVPVRPHGWGESTKEFHKLSDDELLKTWKGVVERYTTERWEERGWYHQLYGDAFSGKKLMDVGCGFGIDSLSYALKGAKVTFVDVVESNLLVVQRLARLLDVKGQFVHLKNLDSLKALPQDFDVIYAAGSLHHAPIEVIKPEVMELSKHLKTGGRWIQLAYPKARWIRDGRMSFDRWGVRTDGPDTPWAEWYDLEKLLELHKPTKFDVVFSLDICNHEFNWFDLVKR